MVASKVDTFWHEATVTELWDGVLDDVSPYLKAKTRKAGKPPSYHKSSSGALSWRTCHDKMRDKCLLAMLNVWIS